MSTQQSTTTATAALVSWDSRARLFPEKAAAEASAIGRKIRESGDPLAGIAYTWTLARMRASNGLKAEALALYAKLQRELLRVAEQDASRTSRALADATRAGLERATLQLETGDRAGAVTTCEALYELVIPHPAAMVWEIAALALVRNLTVGPGFTATAVRAIGAHPKIATAQRIAPALFRHLVR